MLNTDWRQRSKSIISKGSKAPKAKSLADLHKKRALSEGQYFTPVAISQGIWHCLSDFVKHIPKDSKLTVFDPGIGAGSLLAPLNPNTSAIYGVDIDPVCIDALTRDAKDAGLDHELVTASIADVHASKFHVAVINPAFSILISSPNLEPYPCTSYGKYGPSSSAISHEYALFHSLNAAHIVAAILPTAMDDSCRAIKRLHTVIQLPAKTFANENANVKTAVYIFDKKERPAADTITLKNADWPVLSLTPTYRTKPTFKVRGVDHTSPTITLPVTLDNTVTLHHHLRTIVLQYRCGLTQAKVANALARDMAEGERLPSSIKYTGDGRFLIDVLLMQDNREEQLNLLCRDINDAGGNAQISPTLAGYYKKLCKRHVRAITPMQRTALVNIREGITVTAKKRSLLVPGNYNSPSIAAGTSLTAVERDGEYVLRYNGVGPFVISKHDLYARFIVEGDSTSQYEWQQIHKGLPATFPALAHQYDRMIAAAKIDYLANFQRHDVIEGLISPHGYMLAAEQGAGKSRIIIALALMHSGRNCIVLEAGLVPEMLREAKLLNLNPDCYTVIDKDFDRKNVDPAIKLYFVSYQSLRAGFKHRKGLARHLRRFFSTVICDEGSLLKNLHSQQTRSIKHLSARKLIVSDGTPITGYPRDTLPLANASAGNGVAHQVYGTKGKPHIIPRLINSTSHSQRGEDAYYEDYVVTQWCTHNYREDLQTGGRREIPRIADVPLFREWLGPLIQRRLRLEPDLAEFNNCKPPIHNVIECDWDPAHLSMYLQVALEFVAWFKKQKENAKNLSMVAVLAKIAAVSRACNSPHVPSDAIGFKYYHPVTSKQRRAIEYINEVVEEGGNKIIVYAKCPQLLERLQSMTHLPSLLFTGQQKITQRTLDLDSKFKNGDTNILFSSWVGQRGINLPCASHVLFYERSWSAATEAQAVSRTQRPSQTRQVEVTKLHLSGSIDSYAAQMCAFKASAAETGLDFGDTVDDQERFQHIDAILSEFCESVMSMSSYAAKEHLAAFS